MTTSQTRLTTSPIAALVNRVVPLTFTSHPAHPATQYSSDHTEPLHQDRFSRCDRGYEAVFRSLIVLHFRSRWGHVKAKGSVQ